MKNNEEMQNITNAFKETNASSRSAKDAIEQRRVDLGGLPSINRVDEEAFLHIYDVKKDDKDNKISFENLQKSIKNIENAKIKGGEISGAIAPTPQVNGHIANKEYVDFNVQNRIVGEFKPVISLQNNLNVNYSAFQIFDLTGQFLIKYGGGNTPINISLPTSGSVYTFAVSDGIATQIIYSTTLSPSGYKYIRRLGAFVVSSGSVLAGTQYGNEFFYASARSSYSGSVSNATLSVLVPSEIPVKAELNGHMYVGNMNGTPTYYINGYPVSMSGFNTGANAAGYTASMMTTNGKFTFTASQGTAGFSVYVSSYKDLTL